VRRCGTSIAASRKWHRQLIVKWHAPRGAVVLFDRHFVSEYGLGSGVEDEASWGQIHRWCIDDLYLRSDLVDCRPAPGVILRPNRAGCGRCY
jgi:hypothetical protein